eukprot:4379235-Pleurochrysis_carterae.AAC.1
MEMISSPAWMFCIAITPRSPSKSAMPTLSSDAPSAESQLRSASYAGSVSSVPTSPGLALARTTAAQQRMRKRFAVLSATVSRTNIRYASLLRWMRRTIQAAVLIQKPISLGSKPRVRSSLYGVAHRQARIRHVLYVDFFAAAVAINQLIYVSTV